MDLNNLNHSSKSFKRAGLRPLQYPRGRMRTAVARGETSLRRLVTESVPSQSKTEKQAPVRYAVAALAIDTISRSVVALWSRRTAGCQLARLCSHGMLHACCTDKPRQVVSA